MRVRLHSVAGAGEHTVAGKGVLKFHEYLLSFRVLITTPVTQKQIPSLFAVDAIQLAFKQRKFVLLEQEQSGAYPEEAPADVKRRVRCNES